MINREAIYGAFWAKVSAAGGFVTKSRRLKHWNDVAPAEQPALFMSQRREIGATQTGEPTIWKLLGDLYIYANVSDGSAPAIALNTLTDAVCATLAPDLISIGKCTLGGQVHYARIAGEIETDEGTLGDQAVAIIPFEILVQD